MTYTFDNDVVSDLHKDAYGRRPHASFWCFWNAASDDEKQAEWDNLLAALQRANEYEEDRRNQAIFDFKRKLALLQSCGAKDDAMSVRWIAESLDRELNDAMDREALEFRLGLPFGYLKPYTGF